MIRGYLVEDREWRGGVKNLLGNVCIIVYTYARNSQGTYQRARRLYTRSSKSPSTHLKTITRIMKGSATLGFFFPLKEIERLFGANGAGSIWNGGASEEEYKAAYERGEIIND